jgi:hypothetical protein
MQGDIQRMQEDGIPISRVNPQVPKQLRAKMTATAEVQPESEYLAEDWWAARFADAAYNLAWMINTTRPGRPKFPRGSALSDRPIFPTVVTDVPRGRSFGMLDEHRAAPAEDAFGVDFDYLQADVAPIYTGHDKIAKYVQGLVVRGMGHEHRYAQGMLYPFAPLTAQHHGPDTPEYATYVHDLLEDDGNSALDFVQRAQLSTLLRVVDVPGQFPLNLGSHSTTGDSQRKVLALNFGPADPAQDIWRSGDPHHGSAMGAAVMSSYEHVVGLLSASPLGPLHFSTRPEDEVLARSAQRLATKLGAIQTHTIWNYFNERSPLWGLSGPLASWRPEIQYSAHQITEYASPVEIVWDPDVVMNYNGRQTRGAFRMQAFTPFQSYQPPGSTVIPPANPPTGGGSSSGNNGGGNRGGGAGSAGSGNSHNQGPIGRGLTGRERRALRRGGGSPPNGDNRGRNGDRRNPGPNRDGGGNGGDEHGNNEGQGKGGKSGGKESAEERRLRRLLDDLRKRLRRHIAPTKNRRGYRRGAEHEDKAARGETAMGRALRDRIDELEGRLDEARRRRLARNDRLQGSVFLAENDRDHGFDFAVLMRPEDSRDGDSARPRRSAADGSLATESSLGSSSRGVEAAVVGPDYLDDSDGLGDGGRPSAATQRELEAPSIYLHPRPAAPELTPPAADPTGDGFSTSFGDPGSDASTGGSIGGENASSSDGRQKMINGFTEGQWNGVGVPCHIVSSPEYDMPNSDPDSLDPNLRYPPRNRRPGMIGGDGTRQMPLANGFVCVLPGNLDEAFQFLENIESSPIALETTFSVGAWADEAEVKLDGRLGLGLRTIDSHRVSSGAELGLAPNGTLTPDLNLMAKDENGDPAPDGDATLHTNYNLDVGGSLTVDGQPITPTRHHWDALETTGSGQVAEEAHDFELGLPVQDGESYKLEALIPVNADSNTTAMVLQFIAVGGWTADTGNLLVSKRLAPGNPPSMVSARQQLLSPFPAVEGIAGNDSMIKVDGVFVASGSGTLNLRVIGDAGSGWVEVVAPLWVGLRELQPA